MKSVVIYYSQTGNTEQVATAIRRGIQSSTGQCDIFKIKEARPEDLPEYDLIGVGAPAFTFLEPGNVAVFLKRMGRLAGKDSFTFATHAGHPGNVLASMAGKLRRAGLRVLGSLSCDGQFFQPYRFSPWYTDGHPDAIDLEQAADFGRQMAEAREKLANGIAVQLPKFPSLKTGIYWEVAKSRRTRGTNLTFIRERCTFPACRLCIDNCPMNAIDLSASPIIFQGRGCIKCNFCEQLCPTGAIDFPEGYLPHRFQSFSNLVHKHQYPEWFSRAESELMEYRTTLYRCVGQPVNIDDPLRAAFRVHPQRPRVVLPTTKKASNNN